MSDWAWIALIIIVYLVVIKPMFQGIVQTPNSRNNKNPNLKNSQTRKNTAEKNNDEYVDYEEIK